MSKKLSCKGGKNETPKHHEGQRPLRLMIRLTCKAKKINMLIVTNIEAKLVWKS